MSRVYIDTDKLEDDCLQIKEYAAKLDQLLTNYVTRMQKVPTETKEWQGNSAEAFVNIIKDDYKNEYSVMLNNIRKYANELQLAANDYKAVVLENKL
jgi:uncharacterized protein YukE